MTLDKALNSMPMPDINCAELGDYQIPDGSATPSDPWQTVTPMMTDA
ncbi:histidine kinase, partial [Leptolyngbyaceae cyanobacterium CCMR0081]|nr:histidine kinase [Adonisia turfae CCMR0081]